MTFFFTFFQSIDEKKGVLGSKDPIYSVASYFILFYSSPLCTSDNSVCRLPKRRRFVRTCPSLRCGLGRRCTRRPELTTHNTQLGPNYQNTVNLLLLVRHFVTSFIAFPPEFNSIGPQIEAWTCIAQSPNLPTCTSGTRQWSQYLGFVFCGCFTEYPQLWLDYTPPPLRKQCSKSLVHPLDEFCKCGGPQLFLAPPRFCEWYVWVGERRVINYKPDKGVTGFYFGCERH